MNVGMLRENSRDALFIPEEISGIDHGLHVNQPVKVTLEIFSTPCTCPSIACVAFLTICSNVKVPIIDVCSSWRF
ncbi:hypothetical protein I3842_09G171400 [Carya illinoinensis]|uniref:Uncharacterized protein n=1 Tax=Carya illinoinensis TaxID=32201 RepID=A0A922J6U6_CARIL|nr:hypothetical protein I3842_09G171400 [Carya illinoinensis]